MLKRYRSYRLNESNSRHKRVLPVAKRKTRARQRVEDEAISAHMLLIMRVAMSLGFLFCVRIAVAEAQDGFLWQAMGYAGIASTCLLLAVLLRIEAKATPSETPPEIEEDD